MSNVSELLKSAEFHRKANAAYSMLLKQQNDTGMQMFVDYMSSIGFDHDASHNQLTFWSKHSRNPLRERVVVDMQGPHDQMLDRNAAAVHRTVNYVAYYITEEGSRAIQRELEDEPDKLEDARAILKDRANDQDPALRNRSLSISVAQ